MAKKVYQYGQEGNLIGIFENASKAARFFGVSRQHVSASCYRIKNNFCKGFLLSFDPLNKKFVKSFYEECSYSKMYTEKVAYLDDFIKANIEKIDCSFSKSELEKLKRIKEKKYGVPSRL